MAKYQCDKGHTFIHPAKITKPLDSNEANIAVQVSGLSLISNFIETHVCPYCQSLTISEAPEKRAEDWAQVPHSEVKAKLDLGWDVLSHTKDNVVMAKYKEAKP